MRSIRGGLLWLDVVVTFCILSIYGGTYCPDVNESHYMTKAKNFWDPDFCRGDIFLESGDAHWFFFVTFGFITQFTSLAMATWIGRFVCWFSLACGWCRLADTLAPLRMIGTASMFLFLAAIHWGHLSGEWVVGGCEAKCMAYAFAFFGLAATLRGDVAWVLIHFGIACAFHVITGGWIALALLCAWSCRALIVRNVPQSRGLFQSPLVSQNTIVSQADNFRPKAPGSPSNPSDSPSPHADLAISTSSTSTVGSPRPWDKKLLAAALIGLLFLAVGLLPALAMNAGTDTATSEQAAMIYVFARLPHHLRVYGFTSQRWFQHLSLIAATLVMAAVTWCVFRGPQPTQKPNHSEPRDSTWRPDYSLVLLTCFFGAVFALIGALIDIAFHGWAINWSATWLRYYWFRWNDVAWPLAICTFTLASLYRLQYVSYMWTWKLTAQVTCWLVLLLPGILLCTQKMVELDRQAIPPADLQSLIFAKTSESRAKATLQDWQDVCYWIRDNTPANSLWLTPRNQQTFKWYAQRAEVVCWKDSPQNARDLVEWHRRTKVVFARDTDGSPKPLNMVRAIDLSREFGFDYILLDRRSDPNPLTLPILFENDTYAVFQMLRM